MRFLAVLLLIGTAWAADDQQNAYWWQGFSPSEKASFIYGYITAMGSAQFSASLQCQSSRTLGKQNLTEADFKAAREQCESERQVKKLDFSTIRVGQFVAGLDDFYKDYHNKNITFNLAIDYVRDDLKGVSPELLKSDLALDRQLANQ